MNNPNSPVITMINSYVWALLQQELDWEYIDSADGPKRPFSTNDRPELRDSNKPYIIYNFSEEVDYEISPLHTEQAAYSIVGTSSTQVNRTITLLSRALRVEEAPNNIMTWAMNPDNPDHEIVAGMNLGSIHVIGSQSASPPLEEGQLQDGLLLIRYRYTTIDADFSITA